MFLIARAHLHGVSIVVNETAFFLIILITTANCNVKLINSEEANVLDDMMLRPLGRIFMPQPLVIPYVKRML